MGENKSITVGIVRLMERAANPEKLDCLYRSHLQKYRGTKALDSQLET